MATTFDPTVNTAAGKAENSASEIAVPITLRINGKEHSSKIDPRTTLLDFLRETVELTGTKKGCDHGQCGACTVHVNGRRVLSCLNFALTHDGKEITTVEGLGTPVAMHPMQAAFLACDAYQCGYCEVERCAPHHRSPVWIPSWARLKTHIEKPMLADRLQLPHHERIEDATFRRAVDLIDGGDAASLGALLNQHPNLVYQHVVFEGGNYFRHPTLLEFVAENPVRHGTLPAKIVDVAKVILDAGPSQSARNETLMLVATGSVARECGAQLPLIDLLCDHGADPNGQPRSG